MAILGVIIAVAGTILLAMFVFKIKRFLLCVYGTISGYFLGLIFSTFWYKYIMEPTPERELLTQSIFSIFGFLAVYKYRIKTELYIIIFIGAHEIIRNISILADGNLNDS